MRTIREVALANKKVLLRCDLNISSNNDLLNNLRLQRILPTIEYVLAQKGKLIILSHHSRPRGQYDPDLSLKMFSNCLAQLLSREVHFTTLDKICDQDHQITLLENIRFYAREEQNDYDFAQELANIADIYINDAFACSHRAHASIVAITHFLPCFAGFNLLQEVSALRDIFTRVEKPIVVILGGAKISTKSKLIASLAHKVEKVILGGAMANNLLRAKGLAIGQSLYEKNISLDTLLSQDNLVLPQDVVTAQNTKDTNIHVCDIRQIPTQEMILDIGPASVLEIKKHLHNCNTVIWNGPLGFCEEKTFSRATEQIAREIALLTTCKKISTSIVGGGESIGIISQFGLADKFTYLSTGGGAFLEFLTQGTLVGLEALHNNYK